MTRCTTSLQQNKGFSLIEMAVVLVILAFIIGSLVVPISTIRDTQKRDEAEQENQEITEAILGYAMANGYLPCPASAATNGNENRNGSNDCLTEHGFVPALTLGLRGMRDDQGRLLDPWNQPYRYSLTNINNWEYAKNIQLNSTSPDYQICDQAGCAGTSVLASQVVFAVFSLGNDGAQTTTSPDQLENTDNDNDFVTRELTDATGTEFNDLIHWVSTHELVVQLVRAGQLN